MNNTTLQRIWNAREAISRRCDFDATKLVRFYQRIALQQKRVQRTDPYKHVEDTDTKVISVVNED